MAGVKITEFPNATLPLTGTEIFPIVQSGVTKQTTVNQATSGAARILANIAALQALNLATTSLPTQVQLTSNYVAGDGGGVFRYDSTDTTSADNGGTIIVDALNRRWKRQWDETICDARWFGNLATSFATAVQTALDLQPDGARRITVQLPPGTFSLATDLFIKRAAVLQGAGKDTCTISLSGAARIVIGGQVSTTYRAGISDVLITAINAATTPALVFDRANDCFARRIIVSNVDFEGVTLGTSANPGDAELNTLEEIRVLVDAANASGFRMWGGGANQFLSCDTQGTSGQGQTHLKIDNTSNIDTIVIQLGGTGDCDYGLRWIGSANCSNVFATGSGQDRCASGALHLAPQGTASGAHWIFEGVWLSGVGSTFGIDEAAVVISIGAGRSLVDFKLSGIVADSRKEQIRIEGAGTVANICINGVVFTDGARAAANTYPAVRDATTSGVTRLRVSDCVFSATVSTYSYCVRVDTAGTGTTLNDVVDNTFGGAATADVYFAGATYTGGATAKRAALGLATSDSPQFAAVNVGSATDTTVTRVSAGVIAVEGATVATLSNTQTFTGTKTFDAIRAGGLAASGVSSAAVRGFAPGTVADDTAVSTTALSGGTNGVGFLTTSTGRYIFFAWECTGTPALYSISASANTALTTGVLNGTTGVDGNTTLSIDTSTRILYLENRAGATDILTLVLLGG